MGPFSDNRECSSHSHGKIDFQQQIINKRWTPNIREKSSNEEGKNTGKVCFHNMEMTIQGKLHGTFTKNIQKERTVG